MQHVTRLSGSRLQARIHFRIHHVRNSSSFIALERAEEGDSPPARTLRSRSHGNSSLPISALFDPVTIAARTKHEEPKPLPPQNPTEMTDFQRDLAQNVHAQALATPIRACVLTKARLPSHFLIPFVSNLPPKTPNAQSTPPPPPLLIKPSLVPRIGPWKSSQPSSYILASHSAIAHLIGPRTRKKEKGGSKWAMLVSERMKKPWAMRERKSVDKVAVAKEWEWDEEMDERVKGLLGREVVRRVRWCVGQEEDLVGRVGEGDGEDEIVVRIGGEGDQIAGFDLREMVDEEALVELRGLFDGADAFVLRRHSKTVITHLALEALRNYTEEIDT